jgi:hypothetical protein
MFPGIVQRRRHGNNLSNSTSFFQARCFFDGNFIEWVHRHFDVGNINACAIRFDTYFDVVIDYSFDWYQDFHSSAFCELIGNTDVLTSIGFIAN